VKVMSSKEKVIKVGLDSKPQGTLKALGGSERDEWNGRLSNLIAQAMPVDRRNVEARKEAATAALSGLVDINPADPIEGMLIAQMIVANEAALALYRRAWLNTPDYFEAATKYMALADKASRTVALLSERIDQHRTRVQQQIVVKHVTAHADQAVVADQVVTGNPATNAVLSPALLADAAEKPMPALEEINQREPVGVGGRKKE
jgi:hypothetical protein